MYTRSGYKITGLIFLPAPCGLGHSKRGGILACPLPSINPTTSKTHTANNVVAACLKRTVCLSSVRIMFSVKVEQHVNVKFLIKLGKSATECLSHTQVFEWFKRFKEGRGEIEDDSRPCRPCTSKNGC
jgi:hypothetical protein